MAGYALAENTNKIGFTNKHKYYISLLMDSTLEKIDKLRKCLKDKKQLKLLSEIRKEVKRSKAYTSKLCTYLSDTMDGMPPEESSRELGLL